MSYSCSTTRTSTFTLSNARYVASKVVTDLRQFQRWYGRPDDSWIDSYHDELVTLSNGGYVDSVTYGFQRDGRWILTLEYQFRYDGTLADDDRAGGVRHPVNLDGTTFASLLYWSTAWSNLTEDQKNAIAATLPFSRTSSGDDRYAMGRYANERTYSVDGSGASRRMFIPI